MRLYLDVFNNDNEVISDGFPLKFEFDGVVGKVKSRLINKQEGEVDVGCGNAFGGAGEEQTGGPAVEKVNDVIDNFRYEETSFDKTSYTQYFKEYMKKVLGHLQKNKPDRVDAFKAGAKQYFDWIKTQNFDDLSFHCPADYDTENHIVVGYYEEGADAPTFCYIMDGLKESKV